MSVPLPATSTFSGVTMAPPDVEADLLFVPMFDRADRFDDVAGLDAVTRGALSRALESGEFGAMPHTSLVVPPAAGWKAGRIAVVGAGDRVRMDAERARRVAATCGYIARDRAAVSIAFVTRGLGAEVVADGLSAAEFDAGSHKTQSNGRPPFPVRVTIVDPQGDPRALTEAVRRGRIIGESANFARRLANEPGNVLTPREFASRVAVAETAVGLSVDVLDEQGVAELGMRLLLCVAQGSAEPPRLMVIRHEPDGAPASPVLGFVGKGVTFDSGGISIKPADGMDRMKGDMAGGAAVAGAMLALAQLKAPFRVIGVIPMAENMPGARATRPGDVIVGASGTSVEIINTDAEGRLLLADALWYARRLGATHLVDVATLTGACLVGLGRHVSGLFGDPDPWVDAIRSAAAVAGDRVWPMPIYPETTEELRSEVADLVNAAGRPGGAITAAAFLQRFAGDGPWAHLDVAGTAWAERKQPYQPKGATGVATRTLIELGLTGGRPSPQ